MARTSRRLSREVVRARLTVAADRLKKDGQSDLAAAVDAVLAPRGWELLRPPAKPEANNPNVSLFMLKDVKDALVAAAAAKKGNLTDDVDEGFRKFLAGTFTPVEPVKARRGSGLERANLNVRPSGTLKDDVAQRVESTSAELGWEVSTSRVAISYLLHKYGIREEDFVAEKAGTTRDMQVFLPRPLLLHFEQEADRQGVSLEVLAQEGLRAVLAGEWLPPKTAKYAPAGEKRDARSRLQVDRDLLEEFQERLPVISARAGHKVSTSSTAVEWLRLKLGQPAAE